MENEPKIKEQKLYEIWKRRAFTKDLCTSEGSIIKILDAGTQNIDLSGPDFKNARIRIGNFVFVGDIEIDNDYTDWKSHGHNINKRYSKVILHLSLLNKSNNHFVYDKEGRKIHSVCLGRFINREFLPKNDGNNEEPDDNGHGRTSLRCVDSNLRLDEKIKTDYIYDLGIERYKKKCDKLYQRLKELAFIKQLKLKEPVIQYEKSRDFVEKEFNYGDFKSRDIWQQILYEYVFEALGYSKNKGIMLSLAQNLNVEYVKKLIDEPRNMEKFHSILFHVGGLIPDKDDFGIEESSVYIKMLKDFWELRKDMYDGKTFSETQWHFFKLRPQNFPTIRLAGGAVILSRIVFDDLIGSIIKKFEEINNPIAIARSVKSMFVIKSSGFWKTHYIFDHKTGESINYFVGGMRADEIVINVILPFISVYSEVFGKKDISKKALEIYTMYNQADDNSIVKYVADTLHINQSWKRSVLSQGFIELFRNYCSKSRCLDCRIGKASFD